MRTVLVWCCLGLLSNCRPTPTPPRDAPSQPTAASAYSTTPSKLDDTPVLPPRYVHVSGHGITFRGVSFDARSHQLIVADQSRGPGTRYTDAASAARLNNGLAAINGGFFTPEGSPLGLVISNGRVSGQWNSASSLGSGIWHQSPDDRMAIQRRTKMNPTKATAQPELLQAGPMLVDHGRPVAGLNSTNSRNRSFLLWDGHQRWWMGRVSTCSLAQLAAVLAESPPTRWQPHMALNLDGGSSCDLWISAEISSKPISTHGFLSRNVRNFLVLTAK